MREILFRGKRSDGRGWANGFYISCGGPCILDDDDMFFGADGVEGMYSVDPATVGQYTGLKDRNGVRIFEGDIIKTHYANAPKADFIEQVVFHNGRFCSMYERDKMKMWVALPDGIKHLPQDKSVYMEWCEVIGNIHDNGELIHGRPTDEERRAAAWIS